MRQKYINPVYCVAIIILLCYVAFAMFGMSFSNPAINYAASSVIGLALLLSAWLLYNHADSGHYKYVFVVLALIIISTSHNPAILPAALLLLFASIMRLVGKKIVVAIIVVFVGTFTCFKVFGLHIGFDGEHSVSFAVSESQLCDISADGSEKLTKTTLEFGSFETCSYYLTIEYGVINYTRLLTVGEASSKNEGFQSDGTVKIGEKLFPTKQ